MSYIPRIFSVALLVSALQLQAAQAEEWTDSTFADFSKGSFLDGGSNLYVSRAGRVQMINRWDLNGDGKLDLVIPSGHVHTEKENIYVYLNNGSDISGATQIRLPGNGSRDGIVADFNRDGLNDLGVCNGDSGITTRTDTYVYYGTTGGLTVEKRIALPSHDARALAAGDFNGDGWVDLAIACNWQAGDIISPTGAKMSFVYWNSPEGFRADRRTSITYADRGVEGVAAGDLDGDGITDLVLLEAKATYLCLSKRDAIEKPLQRIALPIVGRAAAIGDVDADGRADLAVCSLGKVAVLRASVDYDAKRAIHLAATDARDVAITDFDADGRNDIAVANFAGADGATWVRSYVYWGDGNDFSTRPRTELPTMGASSVSAADLNGDKLPDLVIGNERVTNQHSIPSCVYWNEKGSFQYGNHTELDTQGAVGNAIGDVNNDSKPDVVFFNFEGNFRDGASFTRIFWGDGTRGYSPLRVVDLPSHYMSSIAHADLDDDGFVDLIMTQSRFISGAREDIFNAVIIWWGSADGFNGRTTRLSVDYLAGGVRVADLNRDGWLDLIIGALHSDRKGTARKGMPIFWGSKDGFSNANHSVISPASDYPRVPLIADLNHDGHPDLTSQTQKGNVQIWWGDSGAKFEKSIVIDIGRADELVFIDAADLNKDGWLDLVLPCRQVGKNAEVSSFVYYGSAEGFDKARRAELPSNGVYEASIADLDNDSWLDIVLTSYKGNMRRNMPSAIYWGGVDGLLKRQRTDLPTYGSSGVETADYDGDGWIDILFSNHRTDGSVLKAVPHNHHAPSMLYWGDPDGFSPNRRWEASGNGPHAMNVRDVGNGIDRGLYEDYLSSPRLFPQIRSATALRWEAATPGGTAVRFQLRSAESESALQRAAWRGPRGEDSWYESSDAKLDAIAGKCFQYRARLITPNAGPTASLRSLTITFSGMP